MKKFMERAVQLALQNVEDGGQPFGAVLVKGDEIVGEGVNEIHEKYDVSGHAELLAVRRAQEKLQTNDLSDCIMFASGEPCAMCLTAMYFASINEIYYCRSVDDAVKVGLGKSKEIYDDLKKDRSERTVAIDQLEVDNLPDPFAVWARLNN